MPGRVLVAGYRLAFVVGTGLFILAFAAGAVRSWRIQGTLPGAGLPDSLAVARALAAEGQLEGATREYEDATRINVGGMAELAEYGETLARNGDYPNELRIRLQMRARWPRDPRTHVAAGQAFLRGGRLREAFESFGLALRLDPTQAGALAGVGDVLQERGQLGEALRIYERAVQFDAKNADLHNKLGIAYALSGRTQEAEPHFREALRLDPGSPLAQANLDRLAELKAAHP